MTPLFKKLNFKDNLPVVLCNPPIEFGEEIKSMELETKVITDWESAKDIEFILFFSTKIKEIEEMLEKIFEKFKGDVILWICYPKKSSKKYKSEINRDMGWSMMAQYHLEPVRQIAIDDDWSALRFRKVNYIKSITRRESFAVTSEAKHRTTQKGK